MLKKKTSNQAMIVLLLGLISCLGIVIIQFLNILPASAKNCTYQGKQYPPGTQRGPYICASDGTWQPKK